LWWVKVVDITGAGAGAELAEKGEEIHVDIM
jgi:hypothetical protein